MDNQAQISFGGLSVRIKKNDAEIKLSLEEWDDFLTSYFAHLNSEEISDLFDLLSLLKAVNEMELS